QRTFWEITHTDIKDNSISKILKFKIKTREPDYPISGILVASPKFWYWIPAHLNERIPAQHSLFLFGLPSSGELGAEEIIIESASKEQILKELEALHDICEESLFPDFVGFSNIQRADALYLTLDAEEYFYSGVKAQQRGQYSESIQDLTKAIELKEDYAEAYYARGLAYDRKGEYDQAIQDLTKAIELKEDYVEAYLARALVYRSKGEYDQAIQDLTKVIVELKPEDVEAYLARALAYRSKGEYDQAIQDLTKAIELKEDYTEAYMMRALTWLHLRKWQDATSDLTAAKNMGLDIVASFRQYTESVANFEQTTGITLPEDIAAMLTENEN
ncbi:MAG: tetratricopeptide repeat protein, partial [Gemmatimonadetes bacterium]|nr:tetratricopeptide repeat protein [Gemmatimonadota bacterium]